MKFKTWILLFVLSTVVLLGSLISIDDYKDKIDKDEIKNALAEKRVSLLTQIDHYNEISKLGIKSLYESETKDLSKENFIILFFQDDSLLFWSDNSVSVNPRFTKNNFLNNKVQTLNNAWYWVQIKEFQNTKIVGLILLKNEYEYENKFLTNHLYLKGNYLQNVQLSNVPSTEGVNIEDENDEFLFSIISEGNVIKSSVLMQYVYLISFLTEILLLIVVLYFLILKTKRIKNKNIAIIFALASLFTVRFLIQYFHIPDILYQLDVFSPSIYASSKYFPSLGDLLLTIAFAFVGILVLHYHLNRYALKRKGFINVLTSIFLMLISALFLLFVEYTINSLVQNSSILLDVYKVLSVDYLTFIAFLIIGVVLISFLLLLNVSVKYILKTSSSKILYSIAIIVFLIFSIMQWMLNSEFNFTVIIFFIISFILNSYIVSKSIKFQFPVVVSFIFILTIFTQTVISTSSKQKELSVRKLLAINLANERDPIAEMLLEELENDIQSDKKIYDKLQKEDFDINELYKYINRNFFHGFWSKYDFQITLCGEKDSLVLERTQEVFRCSDFFQNIINEDGIYIPGTNFYFLDNVNGRISYLGILDFKIPNLSQNINIYLEMDSKLISEELGYPELLLEDKMRNQEYLDDYSYAKYRNNELVTKRGDFSYSFNLAYFGDLNDEFYSIEKDGYNHLLYKIGKENVIVISIPVSSFFDSVVSFSYIFSLFLIVWIIYLIFSMFGNNQMKFYNNLRFKIQFSMISILILTLIVIGGGTVFYNTEQYQNKQLENISEKAQSISIELEHKLGEFDFLTKSQEEYLNYYLIKFSNVFYSDINIYDLEGNLLASSRPEIFKKGLVGTKMNSKAFKELVLNRKSEFLHDENIGNLSYISAYTPFYNNQNMLLGYINLPYFAKQNVLKKEISTLVAAIINIYVFLILITIFIAIVVSNNITKPLSLLMRKFREVKLGKRNEPISYNSDDEIGKLVKEYNRMVEELEVNVEKLASSERESAWREMAKQIAHEIKNPLTPMKLSVQHLQRTFKTEDEEWQKRLDKFSKTLIDQIDSLSSIATEFSNFAKMPEVKKELIKVLPLVEASVNLFKENETVKINLNIDCDYNISILGDNEQLLRVFNNLIKNAIQAIPEGVDGKVLVSLYHQKEKNTIVISIEDNGVGIDNETGNKLFMPNFTTKTSGMGLGLAIVKGIVEMLNGRIWYKTQLQKGTTFFVEFPIQKKA